MILAKTPLRICFFGGGSDLPHYYEKKQGFCLSTTIDKYMYVAVCKTAINGVKVVYNDVETVSSIEDINHDRVRESLKRFGVTSGVEISSFAQIPTKGTGLGSSSTFTVGLVNSLSKLTNTRVNRYDLAEQAFDIEFNGCNEYLGKQDQYAAAFGGLNALYFDNDRVTVEPVLTSALDLSLLNDNLLMYFTGITRSASTILRDYASHRDTDPLDNMVSIGKDALKFLKSKDFNMFGEMLDQTWREKRKLSAGISNETIDKSYDWAIDNGALGGKILGAGGGGYFLFYVPKEHQSKFRERMVETGMTEFKFSFSDEGSKIAYAD